MTPQTIAYEFEKDPWERSPNPKPKVTSPKILATVIVVERNPSCKSD